MIHDPSDAIFQVEFVEIDQEPKPERNELKVVGGDLLEQRRDGFDRFQFNQYLSLNYQISPKTDVKAFTFIDDGNRNLTFDTKLSVPKFHSHRSLVNGFEKTRPERRVDLEGRIQHRFANLFFGKLHLVLSREGREGGEGF